MLPWPQQHLGARKTAGGGFSSSGDSQVSLSVACEVSSCAKETKLGEKAPNLHAFDCLHSLSYAELVLGNGAPLSVFREQSSSVLASGLAI